MGESPHLIDAHRLFDDNLHVDYGYTFSDEEIREVFQIISHSAAGRISFDHGINHKVNVNKLFFTHLSLSSPPPTTTGDEIRLLAVRRRFLDSGRFRLIFSA